MIFFFYQKLSKIQKITYLQFLNVFSVFGEHKTLSDCNTNYIQPYSYTLQTKPKALFVSIVRNKKELQFYTPIISLALEEFGKKGKGTPYSINFNLFWNTIDFSGQEN